MTKTKKRKLEAKYEAEPQPTLNTIAAPGDDDGQHEEDIPDDDHEQTLFDDDDDDEDEDEDNAAEDNEDDDVDDDDDEAADDDADEDPNNHSNSNPQTSSAATTTTTTTTSSVPADDEDSPESIRKLLDPLAKDVIIDLLRDAASSHPDVLSAVRAAADSNPAHRKIFVHGLGWDTSAETLTAAFSKYGEIEDCNAVRDKISGKSKGYGFILFKHRSGASAALKEPQKKIGSRMTACQLASTGPVPSAPPPAPPVSEYTQRKIYVSNVSADLDPQRLLQFFQKFGEIEEGPLGLDKQTGKPKGFALFVYKTVESARKALEEPHKNFEGHMLHCQKAIDGPKPNKSFNLQHEGGRRGGGGGGSGHFGRHESNHNYGGGAGSHGVGTSVSGHMMAPSVAGGLAFNQGVAPAAAAALNPALGQALTALLATQGAGLGLNNLLGTLGSAGVPAVNPGVASPMVNNAGHGMQGGYGSQGMGNSVGAGVMSGYGSQPGMQGGYGGAPMGQGGGGRSQQGVGHMGGVPPYMGH